MTTLPIPPLELRTTVGLTDESYYDNPSGRRVFPEVPPEGYESVFDWGSGCGRVARQLILQKPQPAKYVGVDLNPEAVAWCRANLAPHAPQFDFLHHDIFSVGLNPAGKKGVLPFPVKERSVTLLIAWSVFTHVLEQDVAFYLGEVARVLRDDGVALTTWMLFDKADFPMMQTYQNALYINLDDPTNAVIYAKEWLREAAHGAGLLLWRVLPPLARGEPYRILMKPRTSGADEIEFPPGSATRVQWHSTDVPRELPAGSTTTATVSFTNAGNAPWPDPATAHPAKRDGVFAVRLSYSWKPGTRSAVRSDLKAPVAPGETVTLEIRVRAPETPGEYELTFELLQEWVYWFADEGADVLTVPVQVF